MGLFDIFRIKQIKEERDQLIQQNNILNQRLVELKWPEIEKSQEILTGLISESNEINSKNERVGNDLAIKQAELEKAEKQLRTTLNKTNKLKEQVKRFNYVIDSFINGTPLHPNDKSSADEDITEIETLYPTVTLKLHCMDVKDLRKAFNANKKEIKRVTESYMSRYTTKANKTIYNLMTVALEAELQNILYNLKYEKLDVAEEQVKTVTQKYLQYAAEGNQSIVGTLTKFIGEIEYLYLNAVKIEYNYYVKREQAKQEQLAIKEQMRQEAEERKALEAEKKKIAKEEEKYNNEISKLKDTAANTTDESELAKLQQKILELQSQLSDVIIKKDEITNLQNGKAGTVYIISNLGSFGEDVFKVGMTRRLEPMDRINELGNASVPFRFDVHSFIFSDDAVAMETKMHEILNSKRVNKVNLRKEFFKVTIDELEQIVNEIDPTAEFNKTMVATEFRQSLSTDENYTSDYIVDDEDEE